MYGKRDPSTCTGGGGGGESPPLKLEKYKFLA